MHNSATFGNDISMNQKTPCSPLVEKCASSRPNSENMHSKLNANSANTQNVLTPLLKSDCLRICTALQLQHRHFVSIPCTPIFLINKVHKVRGDSNCFFVPFVMF